MSTNFDPASYDAWYRTPRGRWIGDTEFVLLLKLLRPHPDASLLDVGCGTGYFSRRFAEQGLSVTALDPDADILAYARTQDGTIRYLRGDALALPFADRSFDHCTAITSLCFVADPVQALREMLRVARHSVVLGLLNRRSLLYRRKYDRGGYRGARWNSVDDVGRWLTEISSDVSTEIHSAVFFPQGGSLARLVEPCLAKRWLWGSFMAITLHHPTQRGTH